MGRKRKSDHFDDGDKESSAPAKRKKTEEPGQPENLSQTRKSARKIRAKTENKVEIPSKDPIKEPGDSERKGSKSARTKSQKGTKKSKLLKTKTEDENSEKDEKTELDIVDNSMKKPPQRPKRNKVKKDEVVTKSDRNLKQLPSSEPDVKSELCETDSTKMYVGAHVSIGGGLYNAVKDAVDIGAKSFAMFLRSQRQWNSKPLDEAAAVKFKEYCKTYNYSPQVILPHGIYLMNCGSPDEEILKKSRDVLVEELQRCEMLGLSMYNFHPGSTCGKISVDECLTRIAQSINNAHAQTKYVMTILENMSCQGNTVGGKFVELRGIIDQVEDKSRIGVCLDTCHAFAAGFDISKEEGYLKMMQEFEEIVGLKFLKAVHLNDSKGDVGCHLDRHENIGKGKIGKAGFNYLMNDSRFHGIPLILETPCENDNTYSKEIKMLYSMIKV